MRELTQNYLNVLGIKTVNNLEDITALIQAHEKTFAFSSLKVLLKEEISLDLESIYENVVAKKRGGYCFEHNKLMYEVLKDLGFDVEFYLARVINNTQADVPQTHRFTFLNHEGQRYLIDVGIGFRSPNVLVKFSKEETYSHLGISYKIITNEDGTYNLALFEKGQWFKATKFDLNACNEADFEMGHFYSHKHPCAVFVNNLVISRIDKQCIYSLRNKDYIKIYENEFVKVPIKDILHLEQVLKEDFNVCFSKSEVESLYKKFVKN